MRLLHATFCASRCLRLLLAIRIPACHAMAPVSCRNMEAFKVDSWADTQFSSPAAAFASILDVVREYEVTLPGHICAVLITVLVLEGWSSALKPEHSVLSEVKNLVAVDTSSWMERLSGCVEQWMDWAPVLPALDTV